MAVPNKDGSRRLGECLPRTSVLNEDGTKDRYRWTVLAVGVGAQGTFAAVQQGFPALGPALGSVYGLNLGQLGMVLSSVTAGLLCALLLWGAAADRFGERLVMALGLAGAAVALLAGALAPGALGLAAALFAAGLCGASVNAASGRAVVGWFPFRERGLAMGVRQTALPLGAALAAATLPALAFAYGVGGALVALAAGCAAAAVAVAVWVREPPDRDGRSSEMGPGDTGPSGSPLRDRRIWRAATAGTLLVVPQFVAVAFLVVFLHDERGYSAGTAAGLFAAVQLVGGAGRVVAGRRSDVRGRRLGPLQGLGLAIAGGFGAAAVLLGAPVSVPDPVLLPVLLAASALAVSWNGLAFTAVAEMAGPGRSGTALGFYNTAMAAGAAVAPAVFAGFVGITSSWAVGFAAVAACSLLAVAVLAPLARGEEGRAPATGPPSGAGRTHGARAGKKRDRSE